MIFVWSVLAYLAMTIGQGKMEVVGQATHFACYADWVVSTPLLLLSLAFTTMFYVPSEKRRLTLLLSLAGPMW